MIRYTTPLHSFKINIDPDTLEEMIITYEQQDRILLEKYKNDLQITPDNDGKWICAFRMTQEESSKFLELYPVKIQLTVKTLSDNRLASKIFQMNVTEILHEEVI